MCRRESVAQAEAKHFIVFPPTIPDVDVRIIATIAQQSVVRH